MDTSQAILYNSDVMCVCVFVCIICVSMYGKRWIKHLHFIHVNVRFDLFENPYNIITGETGWAEKIILLNRCTDPFLSNVAHYMLIKIAISRNAKVKVPFALFFCFFCFSFICVLCMVISKYRDVFSFPHRCMMYQRHCHCWRIYNPLSSTASQLMHQWRWR